MTQNDEICVALSKNKILLALLGCGVFVAIGVWLLTLDEAAIREMRRLNDPLLVRAIGIIGIIFFSLIFLLAFRKLFDKRPGLILNRDGLFDNSSGVSAGLIPWPDILGTRIYQVHRQKQLVILVRDPEKYIARGSKARQLLNRTNFKMIGSPIAITSTSLKINFDDLLNLVNEYLQKYANT
jgi:hypothetical protein